MYCEASAFELMDIPLSQITDALEQLGGKASCCEMAGLIHRQWSDRKYSEIDLAVRHKVYTHCPQHSDYYAGEPVFEALDVWHYGFWKQPKQYSDRYLQARYRKKLIESWERCMVTGSSVQCRASHIKPRHQCDSQDEMANVFNGLLLSPAVDELFDKGLIGFDSCGQILFSPKLPEVEIRRLGLSPEMKLATLRSGHRYFLEYHRNHVFRDAEIVGMNGEV